MIKKEVSIGSIHRVPKDLQKILTSRVALHTVWKNSTPLARNEWICWIESAKKIETRNRRIMLLCENLMAGKRRPCCWAGCTHRTK